MVVMGQQGAMVCKDSMEFLVERGPKADIKRGGTTYT